VSYLEFHQDGQTLRGISAYQVDPSWTLADPSEQHNLVTPWLSNDEGEGSWIVFDRKGLTWGSIVRSGDTPYNDCLPPSEQLLAEAFADNQDIAGIISQLEVQVNDAFFNPFRVVMGSLNDGQIIEFVGSFNTEQSGYEPGLYRLRDNESLTSLAEPEILPDPNSDSFLSRAKDLIDKGFESDHPELLENDGMRSLGMVLAFDWTPHELNIVFRDGSDGGSLQTKQFQQPVESEEV
jgi:hypothetical protein